MRNTWKKLVAVFACVGLWIACLGVRAEADWQGALERMPLEAGVSELNRTNCVPVMLKAFERNETVKALVFMPGATDEMYFFRRVKARLDMARPTLRDAVVALTNQTLIQALWRPPFLILHTDEDPAEPIGVVEDQATAERIKAARFGQVGRFDDRDWEVIQAVLTNCIGMDALPGGKATQSHHFFRHSFAACDLSGWELLEAVAMSGKTKFKVEQGKVVFAADTRYLAKPVVQADLLASKLETPILKRIGTVELEGVKGRLDHLAVDLKGERLFLAGLANHSIEVVDLKQKRRVHRIMGIQEPQGLAYVPELNRLLVCSAGDGTVRSFDTGSWQEGPRVELGKDADNVRVDWERRMVLVGAGGEPGVVAGIGFDMAVRGRVKMAAHPEGFQVDSPGRRVFVNVPDAKQIAVVDTSASNWVVSAQWPVTAVNFPMALDMANNRLFVGCRAPACVLALDARSGKVIFEAPCIGDVDDVFWDGATKRLYVIGGQGAVDVFLIPDNAKEAVSLAHVETSRGARTGLFIPELHILAVAAPAGEKSGARVLLFHVGS